MLWLLDEYAHIGHMQAIEDAVTLMRGMGVRLWFIFQSLGQIKTCFGEKAQVVLDNCGTQQFFAVNSYETAEYISKRIGDATIGTTSVNDSRGGFHVDRASASQRTAARYSSPASPPRTWPGGYFKEDEILRFDPGICIIFHKNLPASLGRLVRFFEAPSSGAPLRPRAEGHCRPRRLGLAAGLLPPDHRSPSPRPRCRRDPGRPRRAMPRPRHGGARRQARSAVVAAPDAGPWPYSCRTERGQASSGYLIKIE